MSKINPIDKRIQTQIDHLNKNLKKEIDDRLSADDRYRLACHFLDQRIDKLEKKKMIMTSFNDEEGSNKPARNKTIICWILMFFVLAMLIAGIILSVIHNNI
jgi:hypothetical protein